MGVNCTSPQFIGGLLESVRGSVHKPLVVYPNSGEGWDAAAQQWTPPNASGSFLLSFSFGFLCLTVVLRAIQQHTHGTRARRWSRHERWTG